MHGQSDWRPLGIAGTVATGLGAVVIAMFAFFTKQDWMAIGGCLIASAIAFGTLARSR